MNIQVVLIFFLYVLLIGSLGYLKSSYGLTKNLTRKTVHLSTGIALFFLSYNMDRQSLLLLLIAGTLFSFITYKIRKFNFIHAPSEPSLGTLFYPVGLLSSCLILYELPLYYFQISLLLLSISDTVANIGGYMKKGNPRFTILSEEKSLWGAAGFALSAFLIIFFLLPGPESGSLPYMVLTIILAVNFEIISHRGSDNLTVPLGSSLYFYLAHGRDINAIFLIVVVLIMAIGSILLNKRGLLTRYGSISVYILGIYYFAVLGLDWSIPVVFFFLSSTLFTKLNSHINQKANDTNRRNSWQVFANIFFATLSSALYLGKGDEIYIYLYITLIAAVTADTWASEIGPVFHKKCFSLSDWTIKNAGVSGGISLAGSIAALAGALIISGLSCYLFFAKMDIQLVIIMALAGFAASFVDSMLGAFAEHRMNELKYFNIRKGTDRLSPNDIVNFCASFSAPLFFLAWMMFQ
jgi:uncharacterized protein (TIGR00297 family)